MSEVHLERENASQPKFKGVAGVDLSHPTMADRELVPHDDGAQEDSDLSTKHKTPSSSLWVIVFGGVGAIFWISGVLAFSLGQSSLAGVLTMPVTGIASLGFVTLGPAIFIMLAAVLIAELVRFRSTARTIGAMAARFADPARATREDARLMASAVQSEITRVNSAVEGALARLGAMEEVLGHHGEAFAKAETNARERTDALINDLRREREAVADLAIVLDQKAAEIANAITEQSKMVVAAADIANAHSIDSTKTLEESAERLTGAANDAAQGAQAIAAKLDDASGRLSSTALELGDAGKTLDSSTWELDQVRERAQESFAASRDDARILTDLTRQNVEQMQDMARKGVETITAAFESALKTSHTSVQEVQHETRVAAEKNERLSQDLKHAAEEARSALDAYAEVIAKRLEQANEASFSAASWADKTFERLEVATQSLEQKLSSLPETADAQARDLQDKLRKGLEGLNEAARAAADEAEEIDAGFQARIRQNYELLSDFMLRMGSAADQRGGALDVPSPFVAPEHKKAAPAPVMTKKARAETTETATIKDTPSSASPAPVTPKRKSFIEAQIEAQNAIKEKPRTLEKEQSTEEAKTAPGWSWKDVLSGMDRSKEKPGAPSTTQASSPRHALRSSPDTLDRLVTLFRIHDIDPQALFNTQVYRTLSHARMVGGEKAMIDIVRLEAAAQIEALISAFDDDASLYEIAENFALDLRQKVNQAVQKGNKVHLETHLRTGDGPAYLLIETALEHLTQA